jgi:hypothetical protein
VDYVARAVGADSQKHSRRTRAYTAKVGLKQSTVSAIECDSARSSMETLSRQSFLIKGDRVKDGVGRAGVEKRGTPFAQKGLQRQCTGQRPHFPFI